ncbi:hypothetical protein [Thiohalobacter thiocyanaticus]|uniref:Uncharacterized protein n=1 Tax=Thiohalobacter thiocyanaticus TaxID=585455 RepID=A0A426QIC8_9GAMM|nr:hypothetical protein [Thiohalobacter thiocyanaticus]RRQ21503.1 hypothetical protein D6C00_05825 [Thiohalobacter thiocyanaticus]
MKRLLPLLILLLIILILVPLLRDSQGPREPATGLPWQVEVTPDGYSRVFGLTLGRSTFREAIQRHGQDMELAIITDTGEDGSLELFYRRFMAGNFSGQMILTADLDRETLLGLRERAADSKVLDSGARQFTLDPEDLPTAYAATIGSITFIPAANIDAEVAQHRFGQPVERVRLSEQAEHLLYPQIGLDLILNQEGQEVLQYVAPRDFARLREPLQRAIESEPADR